MYKVADSYNKEWDKMFPDLAPALKQLLWNRQVTPAEVRNFLAPDYDEHLHDPFLLPDMAKAVTRILAAINAGEKIVVFADYDADGLPGAALVDAFFKQIGFSNYELFIPSRNQDGFGLKPTHVERFVKDKVNLLITIDCGSASAEALKLAKEKNLEVIVTDHHEVPALSAEEKPFALVNPLAPNSSYPFRGLCGAGVAFKLVQALIAKGDFDLLIGAEKWLLDLVAIATIGDMVPLRDENRTLAHYGLIVLNQTRRPGLRALIDEARRERGKLSAEDIAFCFAPRLNAASRLGEERVALDLLVAEDPLTAARLAKELESLNRSRRGVVAAMMRSAHEKISQSSELPVVVVGDPEWLPGMCGLVASRLVEETGKPSFVWGRGPGSELKGSCRSADVNVYKLMEWVSRHGASLKSFGGHERAGGFVLNDTEVHNFASELALALAEVPRNQEPEELLVDWEMVPTESLEQYWQAKQALNIFGQDFAEPLIALRGYTAELVATFGQGGTHTKIILDHGLEAIAFQKQPADFGLEVGADVRLDLVATLEYDDYRRRPRLRLLAAKKY